MTKKDVAAKYDVPRVGTYCLPGSRIKKKYSSC